MDEAGHEPLTGAGLPLEENRWEPLTGLRALEQALHFRPKRLDSRAPAEQLGQCLHDRSAARLLDCSMCCSDLSNMLVRSPNI
jgi:hypothetical protein